MKEILKNRNVAIMITIVLILLCTVFGAHRSLTAKAFEAERYMNNPGADGYSVQQNLDMRVDAAKTILNMELQYISGNATETEQLQAAIEELKSADSIHNKIVANQNLTDAAEQGYRSLREQSLTRTDADMLEDSYSSMTECNQSIRDSYNKAAIEYNKNVLGRFPANILKKIAMVPDLELF